MAGIQGSRRSEFFGILEVHSQVASPMLQEGTRLALANMFLPGKYRPTASFDWKFLDFGIAYRYLSESTKMVLHNLICPAAKNALLDLYKKCPIPEAYRNGLARNTLTGPEFEDALFQQLIRGSQIILESTDLDGKIC